MLLNKLYERVALFLTELGKEVFCWLPCVILTLFIQSAQEPTLNMKTATLSKCSSFSSLTTTLHSSTLPSSKEGKTLFWEHVIFKYQSFNVGQLRPPSWFWN
jgi:hypothetical protein